MDFLTGLKSNIVENRDATCTASHFSWYMLELGTNQQQRIFNAKTNQSITSVEQTLIESVKLFTRRNHPLKSNKQKHETTTRPRQHNIQSTITCLEK